MMDLLLVHTGR